MNSRNLNSRDMRDILNLVGTTIEIEEAKRQLPEILQKLEKIFNTRCNNFFFARQDSSVLNTKKSYKRGIDQSFMDQFDEYYHQLDPYNQAWMPNRSVSVMVTDHSKSSDEAREYYHDFLKPQSIKHQMSLYLRSHGNFLGVLSLFRSHRAKDFSSVEEAKANLIVPYLANALEKAILADRQSDQKAVIDSISDDLSYDGIIVLDRSMDLVYMNKSASSIISKSDENPGSQVPFYVHLPEKIRKACSKAFKGDNSNGKSKKKPDILTVPFSDAEIPVHLQMIQREEEPLMLIGLGEKTVSKKRQDFLNRTGISSRESDVLDLIAKGLTNKEISKHLFISEYTVENHQRAIYRKLNVNNRTEAANKLLQNS